MSILKGDKMFKKALGAVMLVMVLATGANADIYNTQCVYDENKLYYNHNGVYTHAWVLVNSNNKGDFWEISSGSNVFQTPLSSGDKVAIYFYSDGEYGYDEVSCY